MKVINHRTKNLEITYLVKEAFRVLRPSDRRKFDIFDLVQKSAVIGTMFLARFLSQGTIGRAHIDG